MHLEHYRTWGVEHSTTGRAFLFTYTAHYVRGCLLHGRCVSRESFSRPHCVGCRGDFYIHTRAGKKQSTRTDQDNARHNVAAAAPWSRRPPSAGPASFRLASPASLAQCRPCSQSVSCLCRSCRHCCRGRRRCRCWRSCCCCHSSPKRRLVDPFGPATSWARPFQSAGRSTQCGGEVGVPKREGEKFSEKRSIF